MPWSVAVMVIAIVLITALAKVSRAKWQAIGRDGSPETRSIDAVRHADELRQLKERIAVLERVVTDNHGSIGLDREIERLRDQRQGG